jgi:hypothetical protein
VVGVLWLLAALAFFAAGALVVGRLEVWRPLTLGVTLLSTLLCILGLPESRFGIPVNIGILIFMIAGSAVGWLGVFGI